MAEDNAYAIGSIETKFPDPSGVSKLLLFDCTKEQYSIIDTVRWQGQKQSIPLTLIRDSRNCCFIWLGLKEISSNWNGVLIFAQYTHDLLGRNFKRSVRSWLLWDTSAAAPATMLVFWHTHTHTLPTLSHLGRKFPPTARWDAGIRPVLYFYVPITAIKRNCCKWIET